MRKKIVRRTNLIAGLLFSAVSIATICPPVSNGKMMACQESAKVLIFIGIIVALAGLLSGYCKTYRTRIGIHVGTAVIVYGGTLFAVKWIGGCHTPGMMCTAVAFPTISVLACIIMLLSLAFACVEAVNACQKKASSLSDAEKKDS